MKRGDKVKCINDKPKLYKKGNYYKVSKIFKLGEINYIDIDSENVSLCFTFYLKGNGDWNFNDYFVYDIRNQRKEKLKRLTNRNLWARIKNLL